mmetsp:Transcript_40195/g.74361  ORF Transcript_40195/g.74361 Transcript_40195/m.74361 type:complete len:91 (+) Transcript_40195:1294-1566(+)
MDEGVLQPGRLVYVQIAAFNSAGIVPFADAAPLVETPGASTGMAQECKVYAIPNSSTSLRVEWNGVSPADRLQMERFCTDIELNSTVVAL